MFAGTHKHISAWLPEHTQIVSIAIVLIGSHASQVLLQTFAPIAMHDHDFPNKWPCVGAIKQDIGHSCFDVFVFVDMPVTMHGRINKPWCDITLRCSLCLRAQKAG